MKVYILENKDKKSPMLYPHLNGPTIVRRWRRHHTFTDNVLETRHFRTQKMAQSWLDGTIECLKRAAIEAKKSPYYSSRMDSDEILYDQYEVVEVEVEQANFSRKTLTVLFDPYTVNTAKKFKTIERRGGKNDACLSCGLVLKNVHYLFVGKRVKLCPECYLQQYELAKQLRDKVPSEFWKEREEKLFIERV